MNERTPTLQDYIRVVGRHKWLFLITALAVPLAAVVLALQQDKLYRASAEVLLTRQNLAASLTGINDTEDRGDPDRLVQTQASLASVPTVAQRVLDAVGTGDRTARELLAQSSVKAEPQTDLLLIQVTDRDPRLAVRFATEYARQFTIYRKELDTARLDRALMGVQAQIRELERSRRENPALYADLVSRETQLRTLKALQSGNALLVRQADEARQVAPKPVRNGVLGLGLGLILGIILVFLRHALTTRVTSTEEVERLLRLPLLARIPRRRSRNRTGKPIAMLAEPHGAQAESFRVLRTNVDFLNLERGARVFMVTSALEGEGKSTTVANLAVALARAGRLVAAVDLDLRRPSLHQLFGLDDRPGVTDVVAGRVELDDAMVNVAIAEPHAHSEGNGSVAGVLRVLPAGPVPREPADLIESQPLAALLQDVQSRAEFVLIDTPAMLSVSDGMSISGNVDAILVAARAGAARAEALEELRRVLDRCPASTLGYVLTATEARDRYASAYYGAPERSHLDRLVSSRRKTFVSRGDER